MRDFILLALNSSVVRDFHHAFVLTQKTPMI
jgi:hypothetical protein